MWAIMDIFFNNPSLQRERKGKLLRRKKELFFKKILTPAAERYSASLRRTLVRNDAIELRVYNR
jgi:hypothetical protein